MSSTPRVTLSWTRPPEWDRFVQWVRKKHGYTDLYVGFEVELAWREFREKHRAQELADQLLSEMGGPSEDSSRKENLLTRSRETGDGRVGTRVLEDIKDEMSQFATEHDIPKYHVLRAVVCWRLAGSRLDRVADKLERVVEVATITKKTDADTESDADTEDKTEKISDRERKVRSILDDLGEMFTQDDLDASIHEHAGRGDRASDPTVRTYREIILEERLDVQELDTPSDTELYATREKWIDIMAGSVIDGLGGVSTDDDCDAFTVNEYLEVLDAKGIDGRDESNKDEINEIAHRLLDRLDFVRDDERFIPADDLDCESETEIDTKPEDVSEDIKAEVAAEMDSLMVAKPVATDGGRDMH